MSVDTVLEKIAERIVGSVPHQNLCDCGLYNTGEKGLNLVGWDPETGPVVWLPVVASRLAWNKATEKNVKPHHELHTSEHVVGCYLTFSRLLPSTQIAITKRLLGAWGIL